ncbi:MAG: hypothetical protein WCL34_10275 [Methylococcaceae bacterium]
MQGAIVTLSSATTGSHSFNGLDQIGLGRSICTTTRNSKTGSSTGKVLTVDKTTSLPFNSASNLTITCERQMSGDGKGGLFADAETLVFNTDAGSYQVPMVTIGLSPRVTVEEAVANLQSNVNSQISQVKTDYQKAITSAFIAPTNSITSLRADVDSHTRSIGYLKSGVSYVLGAGGTCPAGYTDLGMVGIIMENSVYGNNPFSTGAGYNGGWTWAHPKLCRVSF